VIGLAALGLAVVLVGVTAVETNVLGAGNLFDRIRSARGVVDFIDIGIGTHRFWTFNLADLAVTLGTAMLTWILCVRAAKDEHKVPTLAATGPLDERS